MTETEKKDSEEKEAPAAKKEEPKEENQEKYDGGPIPKASPSK